METLIHQIKACIEEKIEEGYREFIIFPFGDVGIQVKYILNNVYGIQETYILDNHLCKFNSQIREVAFLDEIDCKDYCLILASTNRDIYTELKMTIKRYFREEGIAELSSMVNFKEKPKRKHITKIGKYSYGPICRNHAFIESIGSFCSFGDGTEVVGNHEMDFITTHPMMYAGENLENPRSYADYEGASWYFGGVQPKRDKVKLGRRSKIGNDVWLGSNVIITNYANIGNGVIAGAGAIITKDIPDYAIVVGVPAKIIRYRYLPEEIESLNKIAWWDWTDEEIRERYDDFYLSADKFIEKYLNK